MRYFLLALIVCAAAFAATTGGPAFSQRAGVFCDQADSTAATLDCINKRNQERQAKLSAVFKETAEALEGDAKTQLNEAQKNWLIYRDAHCLWEAGIQENAGLKRIYELSCLADITDTRIGQLQTVNERADKEAPREFGTQPRWMTALAGDHPQIFWRYGEWKSADLNCDDKPEQIMTGISVAHVQDSVKIENEGVKEQAHHEIDIVVAVSDNPETGRPRAKLFRLPVSEDQQLFPRLCRPGVRLEITEVKPASAGDKDKPAGCAKMLQVNDRICPPVSIKWDGADYAIQVPVPAGGEGL